MSTKKTYTFYARRTVCEELEVEAESYDEAYDIALNANPIRWERTSSSPEPIHGVMVDGKYRGLR